MDLLHFELTIRRDGATMIVAARSPAGEASAHTRLNEEALHLSKLKGPEPDVAARQIGSQLFEALFPTAVRERYRESLWMARERGTRLAIALHCDDSVLLGLPWELAHDPTERRPLAASLRTPFSRTLSLARPSALVEAKPPLRLLVATTSPEGYPPLDISGELKRLEQELRPLLEKELLQMQLLRHATPEALRAALRDSPHLLHLISHGQLDATGRVELVLEDKYGDALTLSADELAAALSGIQLRLALLMACHSGGANLTGRGLGAIGPLLLQAGVGGVVVLSAELSDHEAIAFSGAFYRALLGGEALSPAINIARHEVWAARRTGTPDWAVPVLFTRDPAGRVLATVEKEPDEQEAPNNLPVPPTPLISRERELQELADCLRQDEVRLVTLTGPGGIGKTRLALEAARQALPEFRDGAFFISLAPLTDPDLVPATIAHTLDVQESGDQPVLEAFKRALAGKQMLLVLDNFEHLIEAAPIVAELLAAAPKLKVLATSRERLRLRGEQHYPVTPLETPQVTQLDEGLQLDGIAAFPAVELFRQRAQATMPTFELTDDNVRVVVEICARLDGLPLAIELAAPRIALFGTVEALLQRLGSGLKLKGGARDLHPHQQTLQATIEWSYRLLSGEEQKLFRRLAVFVGGRTVEATEAVCNRDGNLDIDVLDGLEALLDKSLIRRAEGDGEPRFVMLQTIHEFARERLAESDAAERIRRRHAEYFLSLAEEAEPHLRGPEQTQWLERLEVEHDNLRTALDWSLQASAEIAMRLAAALWWFWHIRGHSAEGLSWLEHIVPLGGGDGTTMLQARVIRGAGVLASVRGDYHTARSYLDKCLEIAIENGDQKEVMKTLNSLGVIANEQGDYAAAESYLARVLATAKEIGESSLIANVLLNLGVNAGRQGDSAAQSSYYQKSLAIAEESGAKRIAALVLINLGVIVQHRGDSDLARSYYERSLTTAEEIGDKPITALALNNLGTVAIDQGKYRAARSYCARSLILANKVGDKVRIAHTLSDFALLEIETNSGRRGAQIWAAAEQLRGDIGVAGAPVNEGRYRQSLARVREQLGEQAFAAAVAEGRAMSLDDAIAYALSGPDDAPSERTRTST